MFRIVIIMLMAFTAAQAAERLGPGSGRDITSALQEEERARLSSWQPQLGLMAQPVLPSGDVAEVIGTAVASGTAFFDVTIPSSITKTRLFQYRLGLSAGFSQFPSNTDDFDATLTFIPVLAYAQFGYIIRSRSIGEFKPFLQVGNGPTFAILEKEYASAEVAPDGKKNVSASEMKGTVDIGAGLGIRFKGLSSLEFITAGHYTIVFDQNTQNFISVSLGAAYRL